MDMCWIAAALLIHPRTEPIFLVSNELIERKVKSLFGEDITRIMIDRHLVSWEDRQFDRTNPKRGGSRNRYFFRTVDGIKPTESGKFRLYKASDNAFDGVDKNGKTHPDPTEIPQEYRFLIDWYLAYYFK